MTITIEPGTAVGPHAPPDGGLYDPDMLREDLMSAQEVRDGFATVTREVAEGRKYVLVVRRSKVTVGIVPKWVIDRAKDLGIFDEPPPDAT